MSEASGNVRESWVHAGSCPVCGDGLRRPRFCADALGEKHFYLLCDECEALWLDPDDASEQKYASMEDPMCPICSAEMYGNQAGWVEEPDLQTEQLAGLAWSSRLEITSIDQAVSAPPATDSSSTTDAVGPAASVDGDSSYGQDEPRPGC